MSLKWFIKTTIFVCLLLISIYFMVWSLSILWNWYDYYYCWFTKQEIDFLRNQENTTNLKIMSELNKKCKENKINWVWLDLDKDFLQKKLLNMWFDLSF